MKNGAEIISFGTSEEDAANAIPIRFGDKIKWVQGKITGKVYKFK